MTSIQKDRTERLWNANPAYWKRHAPVLFPIVGKVFEGNYMVDGKEYHLPQHGFARDMNFEVVAQSNDHIQLELRSSEDTLEKYPFSFVLRADYQLEANKIHCTWTVENPSDGEMSFQIGAHPAFLYPKFDPNEEDRGYLQLLHKVGERYKPLSDITISSLDPDGYLAPIRTSLELENGMFHIDNYTFECGAIVLEENQAQRAVLTDNDERPCVAVTFDDATVLGIWGAEKSGCPFICIEPWHGRCDYAETPGEFKNREWTEHIAPHQQFKFCYTIEIF